MADGVRTRTVGHNGTIRARRIEFLIGRQYVGQIAYVLYQATTVEFLDYQSAYIAEADWPDPASPTSAPTCSASWNTSSTSPKRARLSQMS